MSWRPSSARQPRRSWGEPLREINAGWSATLHVQMLFAERRDLLRYLSGAMLIPGELSWLSLI